MKVEDKTVKSSQQLAEELAPGEVMKAGNRYWFKEGRGSVICLETGRRVAPVVSSILARRTWRYV